MKVGVLTHYSANNQGAQLQLLALVAWLDEHGYSPFILTYEKNFDFDELEKKKNSGSVKNIGYYIKNYLVVKGFGLTVFNARKVRTLRKNLKKQHFLKYDSTELDVVIIGSDEVFSIDVGFNKMMYGYGLNAPAVAYAPSFGRSTEELLKKYQVYDDIKTGLSCMNRLSARDTHTQEIIQHMIGKDVPIVCDPVILYQGNALKHDVSKINKPYMLVYSYDRHMTDQKEVAEIKAYAKRHGLITVSCGTYHKWCDKNIVCNAEDWYGYFENANVVLTDTFHGTVAAIKNHCNVAVYVRESINAFKLESLLAETGIANRRLVNITECEMEKKFSEKIDYDLIDNNLSRMAKHGEEYLISALDSIKDI